MTAIRALRQDGQPYLLDASAISDWHASEDPRLIFVDMTHGSLLIIGTLAAMDRAYAAVMQCRVTAPKPEQVAA